MNDKKIREYWDDPPDTWPELVWRLLHSQLSNRAIIVLGLIALIVLLLKII